MKLPKLISDSPAGYLTLLDTYTKWIHGRVREDLTRFELAKFDMAAALINELRVAKEQEVETLQKPSKIEINEKISEAVAMLRKPAPLLPITDKDLDIEILP